MSEPMPLHPEVNIDDLDYISLRDAYRRSRSAQCKQKAAWDELVNGILAWWDDENDGQVVPEFVRIAMRATGKEAP